MEEFKSNVRRFQRSYIVVLVVLGIAIVLFTGIAIVVNNIADMELGKALVISISSLSIVACVGHFVYYARLLIQTYDIFKPDAEVIKSHIRITSLKRTRINNKYSTRYAVKRNVCEGSNYEIDCLRVGKMTYLIEVIKIIKI